MKTYLPIIAVILLFTGFVSFICYKSNNKSTKQSEEREIVESSESKQKKEERKKLYARLKAKADEAKVYSKQQRLSSKSNSPPCQQALTGRGFHTTVRTVHVYSGSLRNGAIF